MRTIVTLAFVFSASLYSAPDESIRPNYREDIGPIVTERCAICHKGPYLELQRFPFYSDKYKTQIELGAEILRRIKLDKWGKMPPVNATQLSLEEMELIGKWIESGLPE